MRQMDTSPSDNSSSDINNHASSGTTLNPPIISSTTATSNSSQLLNHLLLTSPSVLDVALSITSSIIPSDNTSNHNPIMMDLDESVYELITNNINEDRQGSQQNQKLNVGDSNCLCSCLNRVDEGDEISSVCDSVWPSRLDSLCRLPMPSFETQLKCTWNPNDSSEHIYVQSGDPFTFHRHPTAQSTDCIRGGQGFSRGLHVWRIRWKSRQRGTHAVIGVCTDKAPLQTPGYKSLVGSNTESWGWDITRCRIMHNVGVNGWKSYPVLHSNTNNNNNNPISKEPANSTNTRDNIKQSVNQSNTPQKPTPHSINSNNSQNNPSATTIPAQTLSAISNLSKKPEFIVPEYIMVILDMEEGTLSFAVNNQFLGVAFKGLSGKNLYPCVSAVWGHCEVTMNYLGGLNPAPLTLSQACRSVIRRQLLSTLKYHKNAISFIQNHQSLNSLTQQSIENSLLKSYDQTSRLKESSVTNQQGSLINQLAINNALTNNNPIFVKANSVSVSQFNQQNGFKKTFGNEIRGKNSGELSKSRQISIISHSFEQFIKGSNMSLSKLVNCLSLPYSLIDFLLYRPQFVNYAEVSQQSTPMQINLNNNNNNCTSTNTNQPSSLLLLQQSQNPNSHSQNQQYLSSATQYLHSNSHPSTQSPNQNTTTIPTSNSIPFQHIFINHVHQNSILSNSQQTSTSISGASTTIISPLAPQPPTSLAPVSNNILHQHHSNSINWSYSSWNNVLSSSGSNSSATDIRWSNLMVDPHSFVKRIINQTTASTTANSAINRPPFNNSCINEEQHNGESFMSSNTNNTSSSNNDASPQISDNNELVVDDTLKSNGVWSNENQIS